MTERIKRITERTLAGEMYVKPVHIDFDREDLFLDESARDVKRLCEFILAQEPMLNEDSAFTGFFNFDGSVVGDAFHRSGHRATGELIRGFYLKRRQLLDKRVAARDSGLQKSTEKGHLRHTRGDSRFAEKAHSPR